jgi:cephalosporin-C deacetylase-like acetyl esterase
MEASLPCPVEEEATRGTAASQQQPPPVRRVKSKGHRVRFSSNSRLAALQALSRRLRLKAWELIESVFEVCAWCRVCQGSRGCRGGGAFGAAAAALRRHCSERRH